jgi:peroxiredoxin
LQGKAIVAFLRHFGCPFCWEFASALRDAKPKFDAAGFKLITIGVGPPSKARNLAENVKLPCHSFAHPFKTSLIF